MNKTLLTIAAASSLALGGLSVAQIASAEGYGDSTTEQAPVTQETAETSVQDVDIVPIQDTEQTPAEGADGPEGPERAEGPDRDRGRHHRGGCGDLDAAAEAIGIDVDELRAALESGQSVADVATANDVDPDVVVDALVEAAEDHLDDKVEAGRLTEAEAGERLAEKADRIEDRVFGDDDNEAA